MSEVAVTGLVKSFQGIVAVDDISFEIDKGKIVTLLGPSGCGKSTTLRCISGLEIPDKGEIVIGGETITSVEKGIYFPPEKRRMGMVFQNYALWPHMSVFANIALGVRIRKMPPQDIKRKVEEMLSLVGLSGYESRYPSELSGGQQQRVALARSLIYDPRILLLDEPLSNLDAKLRERARSWLVEMLYRLGITCIHVTHDQAEALAISDKIIVIDKGKIVQEGTPKEIYELPQSPFVADFIGATNFFRGTVEETGEIGRVKVKCGYDFFLRCRIPNTNHKGDNVIIAVRPEQLEVTQKLAASYNVLEGKISSKVYRGGRYQYSMKFDDGIVSAVSSLDLKTGDRIYIHIPADHVSLIPQG